jgi:hypothetical protein
MGRKARTRKVLDLLTFVDVQLNFANVKRSQFVGIVFQVNAIGQKRLIAQQNRGFGVCVVHLHKEKNSKAI